MSNNQDDGGIPQSEETLSPAPQELESVHANIPVERSAPVPPPVEEVLVPDAPAISEELVPAGQEEARPVLDVMPENHDGQTGPLEVPAPEAEPEVQPVPAQAKEEPAAPVEEIPRPADPEPEALADLPEAESTNFSFPKPEGIANVTQERPTSSPLPKDWRDPTAIWLPPDTTARTTQYLTSQPRTDLTDSQEGAEWMAGIVEGAEHGIHRDFGAAMAQRPDADWRQRIPFGDKRMEIAAPKIGDDGEILSGERGLLRMNYLLGRGSIVQVPMWHSGFWITFKLPGEDQLLELEERIANDKIQLGRMTHGLAFSNTSVYIANALVDLCMDSIYETTIKDVKTMAEVRALLKAPDIYGLAWGLACVIYPRGFQYLRSLLDEKGQRTEVIREKLNVGSMLWVDNNALNDWQRSHMSNRTSASMSVKNIELYQENFAKGKARSVRIADNLSFTFKTPSLEEYLASGFQWVDDTARSIARALGEESTLERRNALMLKQGRATSMRQYAHWVEKIELPESEKKMIDRASITSAFNSLSADDDIRDNFYKAVREYIASETIAMIATPLISEKEKPLADPKFPWLLPIDPLSVFSTLLSQKTDQISQRP